MKVWMIKTIFGLLGSHQYCKSYSQFCVCPKENSILLICLRAQLEGCLSTPLSLLSPPPPDLLTESESLRRTEIWFERSTEQMNHQGQAGDAEKEYVCECVCVSFIVSHNLHLSSPSHLLKLQWPSTSFSSGAKSRLESVVVISQFFCSFTIGDWPCDVR